MATTINAITVERTMPNGEKIGVTDTGGLDDKRQKTDDKYFMEISVNFNNKCAAESLEELLPVFVTSRNSFKDGGNVLINHLNVYCKQFREIEPICDNIVMVVSKTAPAIKI